MKVWIADDVPECQKASIAAGIAWWEAYTERDLFEEPEVTSVMPNVFTGLPPHGITFRKLLGEDPRIRGRARAVFLDSRLGLLYGVDVGLASCSTRTSTHEIGHALGMGHSPDYESVMHWKAVDAHQRLDPRDLAEVVDGVD